MRGQISPLAGDGVMDRGMGAGGPGQVFCGWVPNVGYFYNDAITSFRFLQTNTKATFFEHSGFRGEFRVRGARGRGSVEVGVEKNGGARPPCSGEGQSA